MRESVEVMGMVLSAIPIGEYDKRLVILTRERGKIHAFARNARKQNSALLACSQPFTFGIFDLYEGKSAYTLAGVQVQNYFLKLRDDLDLVYYGFYFLELADYFSRENLDGTDLLKLLYQSFRALSERKEQIGKELIRYIFEWKLLDLEGVMPRLFVCVACGRSTEDSLGGENSLKKREEVFFSVCARGLLCKECKEAYPDARPISPAVLYTLRFICRTPIEKLYTFALSKEAREELGELAEQYFKHYIDGNFHSLELL